MNFFNIGTPELLLIFVIALIVVGPRRLPQIARDFGKILNDLRKMSQEFTAPLTQGLDAPAKENETKESAEPSVKENEAEEITDQSVSEEAASEDQG